VDHRNEINDINWNKAFFILQKTGKVSEDVVETDYISKKESKRQACRQGDGRERD